MIFRQEMFGYSKEDVDAYLEKTLERLEKFEKIMNEQQEEIAVLKDKLSNSDTKEKDEIIEKVKENADEIIFRTIEDIHDLEKRIHNAILKELEK